ncbi:MAG: 3-methyl-2-oxobutanoate dehydrogenase subunit VorB [Spirochaeta sp.]|nr:3-methyl-2-oxobutanoate dehydrogenase subunit VorB [Spirochaeta sp.]
MAEKLLMKGNEALAESAIIAGCHHYFAYPITPQNEIPAYMARRMPQVGGTFIQAESEIAAINMVFGAAAAGARAMTSSSSPGISLKQEGISYLSGAGLPAVVVNIMRGGPGLGNISGSQADYFQATRGGGHGDYRTIVLAPASVQEMANLTIEAFDLADEYRIVVMILGDGFLGQISEPLILPNPSGKSFDKASWALTGAVGREPHLVMSLRLTPEEALEKVNLALQEKYRVITERERRFETYHGDDADYLLVGFGTSARICKGAVNTLRRSNIKAGLFRPISLWPFPYEELKAASRRVKKLLVVEMNSGQMLEDIRLALYASEDAASSPSSAQIDFYGKMGGTVPQIEEIIERVVSYEK